MPYQQNKPLATDQLDDSQGDIQGNFQEIFNLVGQDHEQFGAAAGQGKHKQTTFPYNVAAVATGPLESAIFSGLTTYSSFIAGNTGAIFWKAENNSATLPITVGYYIPPALPADPVEGFTFFPSGFLVKFGRKAAVTGLNQVITFPVAAGTTPVYTLIPFSVVITPFTNSADPRVININTLSTLGFTVSVYDMNGAPSTASFCYSAIGIGA